MKQFKRPEFKINKINDYSEPVFMACSGRELFNVRVPVAEHQGYEEGRLDARYQVNCNYTGSSFASTDVYVVMKFDTPVKVKTWGAEITGIVNEGQVVYGVVSGEGSTYYTSLGYGDLTVSLQVDADPGTDIPVPEITFAFNPHGCY